MRGVTEWLKSIGLSEYAQRFGENGIDLSVLRDLTEQDLKDLGVLLGHRRKLLRAIAELEYEARPKPAKTGTEPRRPSEGERRHLTVMFCDLVGSVALSAQLGNAGMTAEQIQTTASVSLDKTDGGFAITAVHLDVL